MKSFFETMRDPLVGVVFCPTDGKLPRKFKPVSVWPWEPEPRRVRGRRKRPVTVEQVEKINDTPYAGFSRTRARGKARPEPRDLVEELRALGRGEFGDDVSSKYEPYEFDDLNYFQAVEAHGIRSLMQPTISSADWSWRAPAARCRSCGAVTWIASIADGIRCLSTARHRKGCLCPPSRLEIELTAR